MRRIIDTAFENLGCDIFRQQPSVLSEKTEDDAIKKTRNAKILSLGYGEFFARPRINQLN